MVKQLKRKGGLKAMPSKIDVIDGIVVIVKPVRKAKGNHSIYSTLVIDAPKADEGIAPPLPPTHKKGYSLQKEGHTLPEKKNIIGIPTAKKKPVNPVSFIAFNADINYLTELKSGDKVRVWFSNRGKFNVLDEVRKIDAILAQQKIKEKMIEAVRKSNPQEVQEREPARVDAGLERHVADRDFNVNKFNFKKNGNQ